MCGINGFNWSNQKLIQEMNASIKHRGPDDDGVFYDQRVSLGHVRLSILDLSERGHQPMSNHDKTVWITYNGEIYNFKELRDGLKNKGYVFNSDTDTEVIIHSYEETGINCVKGFNGIFSFCIYDTKLQCIYLVRDRLGIKPLYYYHDNKKFIFSSELKAFNVFKELKLFLDDATITEYLRTDNISKETLFKNVETLKPGYYLKFDLANNKILTEEYANVYNAFSADKYMHNKSKRESELIDELDGLLNKVIQDQLISDAPLGTMCSGGVDSSLVTAIAKKYKSDLKIFNVKVSDSQLDESEYAHKVARHLGLTLIEDTLDRQKYIALYKKCIALEDLPLFHPNSVGIYLISQRAKDEGISVLLSGEGADELFGGYHFYKTYYKKMLMNRVPLLRDFYRRYRSNEQKTDYECNEKIHAYNALDYINSGFDREIISYLLKDLKHYIVPILRRTDRMSMGAGIEMRVPYLDNKMIDFCVNLPLKYKISLFHSKYLLKKVAERYLPKDIVYRKKMGFPLPATDWLGTDNFKDFMYSEWKEMRSSEKLNHVLTNI